MYIKGLWVCVCVQKTAQIKFENKHKIKIAHKGGIELMGEKDQDL